MVVSRISSADFILFVLCRFVSPDCIFVDCGSYFCYFTCQVICFLLFYFSRLQQLAFLGGPGADQARPCEIRRDRTCSGWQGRRLTLSWWQTSRMSCAARSSSLVFLLQTLRGLFLPAVESGGQLGPFGLSPLFHTPSRLTAGSLSWPTCWPSYGACACPLLLWCLGLGR